jgi:ferrochelatase
MQHGIILINLGTTKKATYFALAKFLAEFLMDPRVIDLPWPIRAILVYGIIIPFRLKKSLHAYKSIWDKNGSPLMLNQQKLPLLLSNLLPKKNYKIILAMRYGTPSILDALKNLENCDTLTIVPLYPQYSSAATGSTIARCCEILQNQPKFQKITIINQFYNHPGFINPLANLISKYLTKGFHLLLSFHGIPVRQLQQTCNNSCTNACPANFDKNPANSACYRAQCFATTDYVAKKLKLSKTQYSVSFQSRLGKTPWIGPYTDEHLQTLRKQGVTKLAVACPAFVADCLETLEEIGIQLKTQWYQLGGTDFIQIPCLNYEPDWIEGLKCIINGV